MAFLSFFEVGALKVKGIQVVHSSRTRCNGNGIGALGTRMNLFDRFARVIKVRLWLCLSSIYNHTHIHLTKIVGPLVCVTLNYGSIVFRSSLLKWYC